MKDANGSEDWRVLCELASKEKDPKKMIDLITKINQALRGAPSRISPVKRKRPLQRYGCGNLAAGLLVSQSTACL